LRRRLILDVKGALRRVIGSVDCVLHAQEGCKRNAIGQEDVLRDLTETPGRELKDSSSRRSEAERQDAVDAPKKKSGAGLISFSQKV
jgi:hypothetical protein